MNRQIKFRAWNKDRKEWATLLISKGEAHTVMHIKGEHEDWQQFTGLLDKNGKEIYEGDIIAEEQYKTKVLVNHKIVKWQEWSSGFYPFADSAGNCGCCGSGELSEQWMVCGNIYENPELIKSHVTTE